MIITDSKLKLVPFYFHGGLSSIIILQLWLQRRINTEYITYYISLKNSKVSDISLDAAIITAYQRKKI